MPQGVVDQLEVIQVDEDHPQVAIGLTGFFQNTREVVDQVLAIGKPGQNVHDEQSLGWNHGFELASGCL